MSLINRVLEEAAEGLHLLADKLPPPGTLKRVRFVLQKWVQFVFATHFMAYYYTNDPRLWLLARPKNPVWQKFSPISKIQFLTISWQQLYRKWPTVLHKYAHIVALQKLEHVQPDYFLKVCLLKWYLTFAAKNLCRSSGSISLHHFLPWGAAVIIASNLLHTSQYLGQQASLYLMSGKYHSNNFTALFGR